MWRRQRERYTLSLENMPLRLTSPEPGEGSEKDCKFPWND